MQLLAVSGPFHYWGPVVDGQYLRETPARVLQRAPRVKVDLLIGSSQDDGLINRAKAVKAAAAAAKSLQSCPTLCDPIDGSPPGSPVHGIFQARVLEWGAIASSATDASRK